MPGGSYTGRETEESCTNTFVRAQATLATDFLQHVLMVRLTEVGIN